MQWKEEEGGRGRGRGKGRGKDGLLVTQQIPTHTFRLPSPAASKTLRLRIDTISTQAVRIREKNTYHHLRGYAERMNAPIELSCLEEALATLKHFKNQYDEVY